jgi:hypothetical protein
MSLSFATHSVVALVFGATLSEPILEAQNMREQLLTSHESTLIRKIVYNEETTIYTDDSGPVTFRGVAIPDPLSQLFTTKPVGTVSFLHIIVKGANPRDAIRANTLAIALMIGPEAAVPVSRKDQKRLDIVDADGRTERERMIETLEEVKRNWR